MDYELVRGLQATSMLLYMLGTLYVKKCERNGRQEWICYQSVLSKNKCKNEPNCTARVIIKDGIASRNKVKHTDHHTHEVLYADMVSANNMKEQIQFLRDNYPEMVHMIQVDNIFHKEIAK